MKPWIPASAGMTIERIMNLSVLRIRDFRSILVARIFVMMAWISQDVIIGWQVYSITKSPFMLGLTGLVEAVPALICALFAGHIVDISRPFRVLVVCISVLAFNSFMLMLVGGEHIMLPGGIIMWLFIGIFISGLVRAFVMPSLFALMPQIIPRAEMPSASAFMTSCYQIATIISPAIAGLIYGGYGARVAWFLPVIFVFISFVMQIGGLSEKVRHWKSSEKREAAAKSIKAGWKFIFTNKILLSVMALDMFAVLFGGAVAMLPAYADQVLHVGSEGLGLLRAAPAIGAVVAALVLAVKPFKTIKGSLLLKVVFGFGVCMIGFGMSTIFWASMFFLIMSGVFDSVSMVVRQTLMQWLTPDSMRGRVSAVNSMFIISSNEIGAFESGTAAKLLGLVPSVIFGGIGTLVVVAATAVFAPSLRKLELKPNE